MPNTEVGSAYVTIMPSMKGFQAQVAGQVKGASGALSSFTGIAKAAGAAIAAIGFGSLASSAIDASDAMDKFRQTLDFAGLDASTIDSLAKSTRAYADQTIYDLADIQSITAQLASNGVKDYDRLAEAAGNLNAAAGGTKDTYRTVGMVLTQTAGLGKLTTENWNQLSEAIPGASGMLKQSMLEAGAYTGVFNEAMEKGEITAQEFSDAILSLGMTDAAQQAATSTTTMEGALGNLQAALQGLVMDGFNILKPAATGAINGLTSAIESASPVVVGAIQRISSAAGSMAGTVESAIGRVRGVVDGLAQVWGVGDTLAEKLGLSLAYARNVAAQGVAELDSAIRQGLSGLGSSFPALQPIADGVQGVLDAVGGLSGVGGILAGAAAGFTAFKAAANLAPVVTGITAAAGAIAAQVGRFAMISQMSGPLTAIQATIMRLAPLFSALASPIGIAVAAVAALAAGFAYFYTTNQGFADTINGIFSTMATALAPTIQTIATTLQTFAATVLPVVMGALNALAPVIMQIIAIVAQVAAVVIPIVAQVASVVLSALTTVLSIVTGVVSGIIAIVSPAAQTILSVIQTAVAVIGSVITGLTSLITSVITSGLSIVQTLWNGAWNGLVNILNAAWSALVSAVSDGCSQVVSFISRLPGEITGIFAGAASWLVESGAAIINGLVEGIQGAIDGAINAVSGAVGMIRDLFPFSPAKRGPFSGHGYTTWSGRALMRDFAKGIAANGSRAVSAVDGVMTDMRSALSSGTAYAPSFGQMQPAFAASGQPGDTYNVTVKGITYDDGSNVARAMGEVVRAVRIRRRS